MSYATVNSFRAKKLSEFHTDAVAGCGHKTRYVDCRTMRMAGVLGVLLSVVLVLPLPLVNVPCGIALVLLSLGGLYEDGLFLILGFVAGFASLGLTAAVVIFSLRVGKQILLFWHF